MLLCWLPLATVATIAALWSSLYWSASAEGMVTVARDDFCNRGRLGNKMFHVASAFGIAERSNATFVLEEGKTRRLLYNKVILQIENFCDQAVCKDSVDDNEHLFLMSLYITKAELRMQKL